MRLSLPWLLLSRREWERWGGVCWALATPLDASNRDSSKGIVTADFRPYEPLLEQMRSLNQNIYALRQYFQQKFQK